MTVLALILMNVLQESTLVATTAQTPLEDSNVTAHQEPLWITMESLVVSLEKKVEKKSKRESLFNFNFYFDRICLFLMSRSCY